MILEENLSPRFPDKRDNIHVMSLTQCSIWQKQVMNETIDLGILENELSPFECMSEEETHK